MRRVICHLRDHDWVPADEVSYELGRTKAYVGSDREPREVGVTWVSDEVCARCGIERWWPS